MNRHMQKVGYMLHEKRGFNMAEACQYIGGISRSGMYKLIADKDVKSYLIGSRRYFLRDCLDAYLEHRLAEGMGPREF